MTDTWQMVADLADRLDDHSTLPREQRVLFQLLKIQEEAGEVAEAAIGAAGQNPRKGRSHTWQDVESEVCDVIVTGMVALMRMNPDAEAVFAQHLRRVADRDPSRPGRTAAGHSSHAQFPHPGGAPSTSEPA
ncbi:MazG-like family protein [Streptomyces sp. NPDC127091]|uniref:MazG-like family protein n=1 Tax=Streptomyces sp. NPDC127091 TaxID=3347134 RepID=UPI00366A4165